MSVFDSPAFYSTCIAVVILLACALAGLGAAKLLRDAGVRPVSVQRHIDDELGVACYWGAGTKVLSCVRLRGVE